VFRYFVLVLAVCLVAGLVGCAPSKTDIDKSLREEMKSKLNVEITSTNLTKQPDGGYTGTATAANGNVYDVTVGPPKGGQFEWKVVLGQSTIERMIRQDAETRGKVKVKALTLTKRGDGQYEGPLELENGEWLTVTTKLEGSDLKWEYTEPK
jgi:uncharacterized protein with FMN-binding domain